MSLSMSNALPAPDSPGRDRRRFRRHELTETSLLVERWDDATGTATPIGRIVDLSAGGVRVRTSDESIKPGTMLRVRLQLPIHAGIRPFVRQSGRDVEPANEWIGYISVERRVQRLDGAFDLGGRLLDMHDLDRGMLGLYLSIQPLAA